MTIFLKYWSYCRWQEIQMTKCFLRNYIISGHLLLGCSWGEPNNRPYGRGCSSPGTFCSSPFSWCLLIYSNCQARQMLANMEALMKLMPMDINMRRGVKATLYVTNIDYLEVFSTVFVEDCNWKEYPALTIVQVSCYRTISGCQNSYFLIVLHVIVSSELTYCCNRISPRWPDFLTVHWCNWMQLWHATNASQSFTLSERNWISEDLKKYDLLTDNLKARDASASKKRILCIRNK